jgi:hypothetical protein
MPHIPLSKALLTLIALYFAASLAHFAHNAEYIAFYPGMPGWITRETVYSAWGAITALGLAGLIAVRLRARGIGFALIGIYGAFGLDGLAHYTLALCSEHTLVTNLTIFGEAITGLLLLLTASVFAYRERRGAQRKVLSGA